MKVTEPEDTQRYAALFAATIQQAAGGAGALMARLVAHVRSALRELEGEARDQRERDRLTHSRRLLNQFESALCERFTEELLNAFNRVSSTLRPAPAAVAGLHFDQLADMDEAQVQESVENARVRRSVQASADAALSELNRLVCTMLGLEEVRLEHNPLRPGVYVDAVTAALVHLPVPSHTRRSWISMMSGALGHELDLYYQDLCADLRQRGVGRAAGAAGPAPGAAGAPRRPPSGLLTLEKLRRLLADAQRDAPDTGALSYRPGASSGNGESVFVPRDIVSTAFGETVPAAFEALQEMRQEDQLVQRARGRGRAGAAVADQRQQLRDKLRLSAHGLEQLLGLEVVEMMIDNITRDARLLAPIQRLVADLEPALLQLALVDPRFFSHKQHPARRLLHEITHRSIAFESVESRGFSGFMEPLQDAVAPLAQRPIDTAEPFDQALDQLVALWDAPDADAQRQLARAVRALKEAEQRNSLATTIVADLQGRTDATRVPAPVTEFLCGPWAQVVAHARITDRSGAIDPGDYAQTIEDLIWSSQPHLASRDAAALGRLVPRLLQRLRAGLASIDYPVAGSGAFFELLERLHQLGLHGGGEQGPPPPGEQFLPAGGMPQAAAESVWLAPTEALVSGFIDLDTAARPAPPPMPAHQLRTGVWVALMAEDGWTRTRLIWTSPNATLLLFSDALGYMQSLTRRACEQMFAGGQLRIVSSDLVEDALDAVAQAAIRNSVDVRF